MAMAAPKLHQQYIRHTGGPAWGVGVLVHQTKDTRTYLFADGVKRSFKERFCDRFIVPAPAPGDEDRARLGRGLAAGGVGTPEALNLELEAQIRAHPDDPAPYLVYADWLQHRDDPRGHLITVQAQLAQDPEDRKLRDAERELLDTHGAYLLPDKLDQLVRAPRRKGELTSTLTEVSWRTGFLDRVRIARRPRQAVEVEELVSDLLGHPSAHFLRGLAIGPLGTSDQYDYRPIVAAIARQRHAQLRELAIGDFGPETMELAFSRAGNVSPLFGAAPGLQRLTLRSGSLRFESAIKHATLVELRVVVSTMSKGDAHELFGAQLPALESLELDCPGLALEPRELAVLLQGRALPRLRRLALYGTVRSVDVVEAIAASPLLPRLDQLVIADGDLTDGAAERLVSLAPSLSHLTALDVTGNPLSPTAALRLSRLAGALPRSAFSTGQRARPGVHRAVP